MELADKFFKVAVIKTCSKRMLDKKSKQMETEMEIIKNSPNGNYSPRNKVLKSTE